MKTTADIQREVKILSRKRKDRVFLAFSEVSYENRLFVARRTHSVRRVSPPASFIWDEKVINRQLSYPFKKYIKLNRYMIGPVLLCIRQTYEISINKQEAQ